MTHKKEIIPQEVIDNYLKQVKQIKILPEWKSFISSDKRLDKSASSRSLPFDWRFNSVHWAFDVSKICTEIVYSLCWMRAYADYYKSKVAKGSRPSHSVSLVTYFADNSITRIDSCKDKIALMVWSYFCPFNPEKQDEVLNCESVLDRLKNPIKFGLRLRNTDAFLECLPQLINDNFKRIEKYRHLKIHRREPRIELYGVASHHGWSYMFPLLKKDEIESWDDSFNKQYATSPAFGREKLKSGSYIDGVLFDRRKVKDCFWDYDEVEKLITTCLIDIIRTTDGCFRALLAIAPLRGR